MKKIITITILILVCSTSQKTTAEDFKQLNQAQNVTERRFDITVTTSGTQPFSTEVRLNGTTLIANQLYTINFDENKNIKHNGQIIGFKDISIPLQIRSTTPLKMKITGSRNVWLNTMGKGDYCNIDKNKPKCRGFKYILFNPNNGLSNEIKQNYSEKNHLWVGHCQVTRWCKYELKMTFNQSHLNRGAMIPGSYGVGYLNGEQAPELWLIETI